MTTSKSIKEEFNLPEGEELYTRENLDAIEKNRKLLDDDLVLKLQQFLVLHLRSNLTTGGRERIILIQLLVYSKVRILKT